MPLSISANTVYSWEMELLDGTVHKQFDENGVERTWKDLPADMICRVSFIPSIPVLPQHNLFINHEKNERFVRRFGRGFIKTGEGGMKLREYINVIVTTKYRFHLFSNGSTLVTEPNHEVYL